MKSTGGPLPEVSKYSSDDPSGINPLSVTFAS
jgi:hypothetical protein